MKRPAPGVAAQARAELCAEGLPSAALGRARSQRPRGTSGAHTLLFLSREEALLYSKQGECVTGNQYVELSR